MDTKDATTDKRKSADVMVEIQTVIGGLEGIAVADIFKLAELIRDYGSKCAGEAIGPIITTMLEGITKPRKNPDEPWKGGL